MFTIFPLQELLSLKDEGFEKLQQTVNASQQVLPNTAARGKDEIRNDMQKLQKAWDDLFADLNAAKVTFPRNSNGPQSDELC